MIAENEMSTMQHDQTAATLRELGLSDPMINALLQSAGPGELSRLREILEERGRLLKELEHHRERERQIAQLIGARSVDKLMHDLRNVLNELTLLRAVSDAD
jgi:hypothetical protein